MTRSTVTTTDDITETEPAAPRPVPDHDSETFWAELRAHRIVLQSCTGCGRRRFPAIPSCPYCAHPEWRFDEVSGTGSVFSYIIVHRAFDPAFTADVPYPIGTVDLDGGGRIVARIEGTPAVDSRVTPAFVDHPEWTELRFRMVEKS
jgi:uncharacterized OB-fold protein